MTKTTMTKIEQLTQVAAVLPDERLDGLIAYARYLADQPVYHSAPPEALASIERGLAEYAKGQGMPASEVFARLRQKTDAAMS